MFWSKYAHDSRIRRKQERKNHWYRIWVWHFILFVCWLLNYFFSSPNFMCILLKCSTIACFFLCNLFRLCSHSAIDFIISSRKKRILCKYQIEIPHFVVVNSIVRTILISMANSQTNLISNWFSNVFHFSALENDMNLLCSKV